MKPSVLKDARALRARAAAALPRAFPSAPFAFLRAHPRQPGDGNRLSLARRARTALRLAAVLAVLGLCAGGHAGAADAMSEAHALLRQGRAASAYELLAKQEAARAGDIDFDTLLGVAALDAGHPDRATLAFERVLAQNPNAHGVRLDMARAYFALGDDVRARRELDLVAANAPPPAARLVIDKYLAALDARAHPSPTTVTGYLESFAGYDSNITSVVGDFTGAVFATYGLAGFRPTGNSVKRDSPVAGAAGGVEITHRLNDRLSLFAGADVRHRAVLNAANYTSDQLDLRAGASYAQEADLFRGGIVAQSVRQVTDVPSASRTALGVNAEWRHTVGTRDQASLFAYALRQRYADLPASDVNTYTAGGGWLHLFEGAYRPLVFGSLLAGRDSAQNQLANGADNSKRFYNARVYGQISPRDQVDLFGSVGILYRVDQSQNARSPTIDYGNDLVTDLVVGANWRPARNWTVRPQLLHTRNRSNIALSEYVRTEALVTVRYDFH